jgi:isopenicillin-N N-acyltransferase-like protein
LVYAPLIHSTFPHYESEMRGIAHGAGVDYEDILALNVRTELVFGTFMDGCTALSWRTHELNVVCQNWDVGRFFRSCGIV